MSSYSGGGKIDFSKAVLKYNDFELLAKNQDLSSEEQMGFKLADRRGYEDFIFQDIVSKLSLLSQKGKKILNIGCGHGKLNDLILSLAKENQHHVFCVDNSAMLENIPDYKYVTKVAGRFPDNFNELKELSGSFDIILCYSVIQIVYNDNNVFAFVDSLLELLGLGGEVLIGDIPNISMRKRFFSTELGVAFHKEYMNTDSAPNVEHFKVEKDKIDDAIIMGIVSRARSSGFNAYVVPQGKKLKYSNRREDVLIKNP